MKSFKNHYISKYRRDLEGLNFSSEILLKNHIYQSNTFTNINFFMMVFLKIEYFIDINTESFN